MKVYDFDDNEKTYAWAQAKFGVAFERAQVAQGQKVFRLVALKAKAGDVSLISKVLDENGNPINRQNVAFYWPDAPSPPEPPTTVYPHDWSQNFIHGLTNANGEVGPAMGPGAYIGEGECGPHEVWVRDPNIPSDLCKCLGMIAGTFHHHIDQVFQLQTQEEEGPPADISEFLLAMANDLGEWAEECRALAEEIS